MIPNMEPPIESSVTARLDFPEPLSFEHRWIIELLTERYIGDTPFMTFSRFGTTTLIVPKIVRGNIPALGGPPAIQKNIES